MKAVSLNSGSTLVAVPDHVAIIMDGNGRWAKSRGLPRTAGHQRGAAAVRRSVEYAIKSGISYLTLFGFSSENWKRPATEVKDLMGLLRLYLRKEIDALDKEGVRFQVIGERSRLAPDIVELIESSERQTAGNSKLVLTIALSYGGRAEIVEATRRIAVEATTGAIDPAMIDEDLFDRRLFTTGIPDPDLLIRTSGEQRISNFLLWQLAYTELVFIDTLWPDFAEPDFYRAIEDFRNRERRYGTTGA